MATAEEGSDGFEFLADPVDRFPLADLGRSAFTPDGELEANLTQSAVESSMGDVGDVPLTLQMAINNGCEALSFSATDSQQSTGKDDPQASGWTKRFLISWV
ncbi:hypothetical protein ACQJBY_026702 [Aegilops geniculata]